MTKNIENKANIISKILTILFIILIICFSSAICYMYIQNDTFYSIKIGQHIFETKSIDMKDMLSWHNLPYSYPHWLFDLLTFRVFKSYGLNGIHIMVMVFSSIISLLMFYSNYRMCKNKLLAFLMTILYIYLIGSEYFSARAQVVSYIVFELQLICISEIFNQKKLKNKLLFAIFIFALAILIANTHIAVYPFMYVLFFPYLAELFINVFKEKRVLLRIKLLLNKLFYKKRNVLSKINEINKQLKSKKINYHPKIEQVNYTNNTIFALCISIILISMAGLITPLGKYPYIYQSKILEVNSKYNDIVEHLPLTFYEHLPLLVITTIPIIALIFINKSKIKLSDMFLILGLLFMTVSSTRHQALLVILCGPIFTKYLYELLNQINYKYSFKKYLLINALCLVIVTGLIYKSYSNFKNVNPINNFGYPIKATDYLLDNYDFTKVKLINAYNDGAYLAYRGIPVFIDSRQDLYSKTFNKKSEILLDEIKLREECEYDELMKKYNADIILISKNEHVSKVLEKDDNYKLVYSDNTKKGNFEIFEKKK